MKQPKLNADSLIDFLSNLLAVVLGIIITFWAQGMIDRAGDRKEVRSALELVRKELSANAEDIGVMSGYLVQERKSAEYFLAHRSNLGQCPEDSLAFHRGIIFADASLTLSRDALDLMTMSSLFQKVGDNALSMKIIRAYDACESAARNLNQHIELRDARLEGSVTEGNVGEYAPGGHLDLSKYLNSDFGLYTFRWITGQADPLRLADVSDIEEAVKAVEDYLE